MQLHAKKLKIIIFRVIIIFLDINTFTTMHIIIANVSLKNWSKIHTSLTFVLGLAKVFDIKTVYYSLIGFVLNIFRPLNMVSNKRLKNVYFHRYDMMMRTKMKDLSPIPHSNRVFPSLYECRVVSQQNWPPRLSRISTHFIITKE